MMLLSECYVFVYEVRMMWCCWVSVMCLCMKWGWCKDVVYWVSCVCVWSEYDITIFFEYIVGLWIKVNEDAVEWVSCVCLWSKDDTMLLLNECVCVFFWLYCCPVKWGWCDDVDEWMSSVCVWSEDDGMLLSECHVFAYEVRIMWWCCWVSVMCFCMKWG